MIVAACRPPCRQNGRPPSPKPLKTLERVKGIEPSSSAWKAVALPLSYTRIGRIPFALWRASVKNAATGFHAKPAPAGATRSRFGRVLRSGPFDFGTHRRCAFSGGRASPPWANVAAAVGMLQTPEDVHVGHPNIFRKVKFADARPLRSSGYGAAALARAQNLGRLAEPSAREASEGWWGR